jgi:ribosomal-protein-alanine N-acetyltransferase
MIGMAPMLRDIQPADAALLAALHVQAMDDFWSAETFGELVALPGAFGVLAARGEMPTGFVLARAAADEAEILTLVVIPTFRRQGIGRALLEAAARAARVRGARRLFLEVAAENEPALALYRANGFVAVGRRKDYYARRGAPAIDALILASRLDAAGAKTAD